MHKTGKWAQQILQLQDEETMWGDFHSLAVASESKMTTEQALRRLERLGYTAEDVCRQKALQYMHDCLSGQKRIPDRVEKVHDWNVFLRLILSTGIRRFTREDTLANEVAVQWTEIVTEAFSSGEFDNDAYLAAYRRVLHPKGGRIMGITSYYPVSLLCDMLDEKTEKAYVRYLLNREDGIYYIYDKKLSELPAAFESREASRYLAAMELLSRYEHARQEIEFVVDWLQAQQDANGKWDMGKTVNDKVYFPLSDNWRKAETRIADCTERIERLIEVIKR